MSTGKLQWIRVMEVSIGPSTGGKGLFVDKLRMAFKITKTITRNPNHSLIRIWNLSPENEGKIKGEFDSVIVNAGYKDNARLLFRGSIKQVGTPRDGLDYITEIEAADGDRDFKEATVTVSFAAGTMMSQVLDHLVGTLPTVKRGYVVLKDRKLIRGMHMCGPTRNGLDFVAQDSDAHWSFQDGNLHIVPVESTLPTEAIKLTSDTGLLGAPERTDKGIVARCLMNPDILPNGKIWLDNNTIKNRVLQQHQQLAGKPHKPTPPKRLVHVDPDGVYKVYKVEHEGDTRSSEWTSKVYCVGLGKAIPTGKAAA